MSKVKGLQIYKNHWEDQVSFMDQSPWNRQKILKLTLSNDFKKDIEELQFSNHSLTKEGGKLTLRLKVPYNYSELDDFEFKAIELLGIDKNVLIDIRFEKSQCTHHLKN